MTLRNALILAALPCAVAAGALIAVMQSRAADSARRAEAAPPAASAPQAQTSQATEPGTKPEPEPEIVALPVEAPAPDMPPVTPSAAPPPAPAAPIPAPSASASGAGLIVPVAGVAPQDLREDWGDARSGGRGHQGLDIPAKRGAPVLAADSGEILKFFDSDRGGITIYQADSSGGRVLYYAHLQRRARGLEEGETVSAGQVIGYVGSTGNAADDNPHLHFEVAIAPESGSWYGGTPLNPYPLLADER